MRNNYKKNIGTVSYNTEGKPEVKSVTLVGGAYHNGRYCPGWATAHLADGTTKYLGGDDIKGFDGAADAADRMGLYTGTYRAKLDLWVKTGKFE